MTVNEYQKMAMATLNPALAKKDVLINGVMGLCGEAGEAIDVVKKHLAQGHPLDREHLIQELGDVAWYLAETATALDVDLEEVFSRNIEKLRRRYPQGFAAQRSLEREESAPRIRGARKRGWQGPTSFSYVCPKYSSRQRPWDMISWAASTPT